MRGCTERNGSTYCCIRYHRTQRQFRRCYCRRDAEEHGVSGGIVMASGQIFFLTLVKHCTLFFIENFQIWNKDDNARELLINRKDHGMVSPIFTKNWVSATWSSR